MRRGLVGGGLLGLGLGVAVVWAQTPTLPAPAKGKAVLDIVSDGRMDLGTGRSTTLIEMDGFQVDPEETRAQWEAAIAMIPRMWTEDPFCHAGRFYQIPPRSVIPKPVQKPHEAHRRTASFNGSLALA